MVVTLWNLIWLYPQTRVVAYVNDSAMHEQMVRFSATKLRGGSLPATHWYPLLNEGSPQFLHYQQLGADLFGSLGAVTNPTTTFHWSSYLLLALWPIVIYLAGRMLGMPPLAAACSAAISPFLVSIPGVGYEQKAYVWIGFGLWAQLCASWTLPFAWAATWRSMDDRRWLAPASLFIVLTIGFHFETGYLAVAGILTMPWLEGRNVGSRLRNALVLLLASLIGSSWVTIPLVMNARWAAINSYLARTGLVRGYGARQDLSWLLSGKTFDDGRLPVVTCGVAVGLVIGLSLFRRFPGVRPMAAMLAVSLVLSFGPTTWGPLVDVIPGHTDIFFRRFLMGVDLAGIYLAGLGVYFAATIAVGWRANRQSEWSTARLDSRRSLTLVVLLALVLVPAASELAHYDSQNASFIGRQFVAERAADPDLRPITEYISRHDGGRVFAGSPLTGGGSFAVGFVPMYEFLANQDIDTVGFTMRTASLMSQPENYFDPSNPSDYELFGVRYVLLPTGREPKVRAKRIIANSKYTLWTVPGVQYLDVVRGDGTLHESRFNIGAFSIPLLKSRLFGHHADPVVVWTASHDGYHLGTVRRPTARPIRVSRVSADLTDGSLAAQADTADPSIAVLSASYDPGWHAWVNGHSEPVVSVAPALVGVRIPAGTSVVRFEYQGFRWYPELAVLSLMGLVFAFLSSRRDPRARGLLTVRVSKR